ncbi:MAG: hypothetical protein ACHQCH_00550 [Solirubrobacterales bacterium]
MRHRIAAISIVMVALIAGGVTIAVAGSGNATAPLTKAQAVAYAHAVNLRASDLPGATSIKGAIFGPEAVQYEALKCGLQGRPGIVPVGGGESWLSNRRALAGSVVAGVGSLVVVAPSNYYAEAEIAGLQSSGGRTCLARALGRALEFERHHKTESSHTVKVTVVPIGKYVAGVHLDIHVLAKLPPIEGAKPETRYINVDAAFFRVGPADVAFFALGATRFPPATEIQLLALLHSRAEAHKLS